MRRARREVSESTALDRRVLLTSREGQVFELLGHPMNADEIATALRLKRKTVDTHLDNIGRKLGWTGAANLRHLSLMSTIRGGSPPMPEGELLSALRAQIEHQAASRRALLTLLEATAPLSGERFLLELAEALSTALGARLAAIVVCDDGDPDRLRALSLSIDGHPATCPPFERAGSCLDGPPERFVDFNLAAVAPRDPLRRCIDAQVCHALRLSDDSRKMIGGLVLMHDGPFDERRSPELILRLVAGRVAAELSRARSERRLRESALHFRLLTELSSDVISRHSLTGVYTYVSPAIETVLGYKPEEIVGRSGYDLIVPEDIKEVGPIHHAVLQDGAPRRIRFRVRRRSGETIWFESYVRGVHDPESGAITEIYVASRDVTPEVTLLAERSRRAEQLEQAVADRTRELLESQRRWQSALSHASDFIYLLDRELRITFANKTLPEFSVDGVTGTRPEGYMSPEESSKVVAAMRSVLEHRVPQSCSWITETPSGRLAWESRFSPIIIDGEVVGISSMSREVTAERKTHDALLESEARYRQLVEHSPDGILVHDGSSMLFANPALAAMLGWPSAEAMVGHSVLDLIDPRFHEIARLRMQALLDRGGSSPRLRERLLRRDGSAVWADVVGVGCVYLGVPAVQALVREIVPAEDETSLNLDALLDPE